MQVCVSMLGMTVVSCAQDPTNQVVVDQLDMVMLDLDQDRGDFTVGKTREQVGCDDGNLPCSSELIAAHRSSLELIEAHRSSSELVGARRSSSELIALWAPKKPFAVYTLIAGYPSDLAHYAPPWTLSRHFLSLSVHFLYTSWMLCKRFLDTSHTLPRRFPDAS